MEKLFEKLTEYLHMDTEIPFEEFSVYYQDVIDKLNQDFQELSQDECVKARYICSILQANAEMRAKNSKAHAKAFKKMMTKSGFWADAIAYRLLKEGMTQEDLDKASEALNDSI